MWTNQILSILSWVIILSGCNKGGSSSGNTAPVIATGFVKGADISWMTQMEGTGYQFYNAAGTAMDCVQLMKSLDINTVRLRVWVNPVGGWNNTADVVAKAVRANRLGLRVLIDFHYSDTWADPGHQTKPAAWSGYNFTTLTNTVYSYTLGVLDTLKMNGVIPVWVQVGNETDNGMLWPDGMASTNMANFATLVNAGYRAVKAVSDSIKVIVHISGGYNNARFRWIFDGLTANGANWDIIGMSLYPSATNWQSYNDSCLANMNDMITRYNKQVMVCEVGMPVNEAATCDSFITDLISKTRSITGGKGLGVLYWEPECYNYWQGYGLGAFDNTGRPTVAMNAFMN
jgi:arabinogalactan endo-1,4-beta-galactosidase